MELGRRSEAVRALDAFSPASYSARSNGRSSFRDCRCRDILFRDNRRRRGANFARDRPTSLIQRMIDPQEIASLVAYVASPLSAATNGAALRADGGITPTII